MRKSWLRIGLGLVGAAGITVASISGGTIHASANTPIAGFNLNGDGGCHNLNPVLEANTSALTAVADNTRAYAQIQNVAVTAGAATADGISEAKVVVTLCGAVPAFPVTGNGDTGVSWYACFDPKSTQPIVSSSTGVQTGVQPITGNPTHDGPYPKSQGFRFCAWASVNAGTGLDYGVAWSDPIAQFTFLDPANMFDGSLANQTISTATVVGNTVTMFLPNTWRWTVSPGSPLQSLRNETVATAGDVTTDWSAQAWVNAEVNLPSPPAPICVPTTCIQGIIGLLVPVDFAPGYQLCATAVTSCANFDDPTQGRGTDLGIEMDFPVGSIQTCVNPVNPATDAPGALGNPDITCTVSNGFGTAGLPWVYAPVYGRILPAPVTVNGQSLHPFGNFTPDNVSETL